MTITIPLWLLWTVGIVLGVPLVLGLLFFAFIGIQFFIAFTNWRL